MIEIRSFQTRAKPAGTQAAAQRCSVVCCRNVRFFGERNPVYGSLRGRKDFLPVEPQGCLSFLILLANPGSPKTTPVATWLTPDMHRTHGRPSGQEYRLRLKRPTPNAARRCPPFKSSTATRSCSYGLFPWVALLRFAFGRKIWHTIFFRSKPNFKIFPKLLPKPRRASQSLKNSLAMVLPRYPAWNTSPCLLAKSPSLSP